MKTLEQLVRPNIRALKPYSTARDEYAGGEITTWLDANENPYENGVNRYPDPHQKELKRRIAALKGVREEQVFIGNGSDEAIDLCYRIFCRPGVDNAVSIAPTYGMYRVAADINDVEMREVPLGADFSLPADALLAAADERTRLLWLCSPNNPTGNAFPAAGIERLLREFDGMVVLDEAYIDFAAGPGFLARLGEFGNLIVLQTLSKAWGMAGLRLGLAFASEAVAGLFARVKYPYNTITLAQYADRLDAQEWLYPDNYVKLRFLENHDRARAAHILPEETVRRNWTAFNYFQRGLTLVYAGQEVDDPHVPSLFDKDPVHWQTGRDQSDFLIRLAAIKRDPIFAEGSYTLTALPHDVLLAVYEQNGRRVAGLFSLRGASALVHFPAPNGVYHDSITGRPVEIYENQLATDGQPLILEL